jgi:predicted Rossmann fold flavoprotein
MPKYDLIIIGGGASGLFSGIIAKDKGLNFLIIEKNPRVGMKLGLTGKGRCNLTNYTTNLKELVKKYTHNGKFLYHAFSEFGVQQTYDFFENRLNIPLKVERGKRVFPKSDKALDVVNTLFNELKENILLDTTVADIKREAEKERYKITKVVTDRGEYIADNYILATGGKTYPSTGSTGNGYDFAKSLGHSINPIFPVLVGFKCREDFVKDLAGLTLKFINVTVFKKDKKFNEEFGDLLFTHEGISGPTILNLSQYTYDMYNKGFRVSIDLKPRVSFKELDERVNNILRDSGNIFLRNSLGELMPSALIPIVISLSKVDGSKKASEITKEERHGLVHSLKDISLTVYDNEGYNRAVVNTGGVDIKEIDPYTMQSRLISNLYFTGDIIDVFGPTGGFNLQVCWSTGRLAVESVKS